MAAGDPPLPPVYAVNSHYVARAGRTGIHVQCLHDKRPPFCLPYDSHRPQLSPVLALSPTRQNLLAAANGPRVLILNLAKKKTRCILKGNHGRIVTSIAFSEREHDILATGAIDGSVCVWSIKQPSRPLLHLDGLSAVCNHIALHSFHTGLLATVHHHDLVIWSLSDSKMLTLDNVPDAKPRYLAWRSRESIIAVAGDGCLTEATLGKVRHQRPPAITTTSHGDDVDGTARNRRRSDSSVASLRLPITAEQASVLGANGMVVLPFDSDVLYFYSYSVHDSTYTELWRLHIDSQIDCFALRRLEGGVDVSLFASGASHSYNIPAAVLDAMHWSSTHSWMFTQSKLVSKSGPAGGKMIPERPQRRKTLLKQSSSRAILAPRAHDNVLSKTPRTTFPLELAKSDQRSMTSSLELPKDRGSINDDDSPMPFLSPSIPARRHGLITPLEDDLSLLPRSSFNSMTSTATHEHDSDSDDETFAGNLRHSSSFLPGGVNVPLPRTCGAAFAPNGHLLTFFPFQPRPGSSVTEKLGPRKKHPGDDRSVAASMLFPSFANFGTSEAGSTWSENSGSLDDILVAKVSSFVQTPLSEHRPSWSAKVSPVKTTSRALPTSGKISISVCNFEALTPTRKLLATTYNICVDDSQSAADLSLSNALAASSAAMYEAAEAWRLLAIILEARSVASHRTDFTAHDKSALPQNLHSLKSKITPLRNNRGQLEAPQSAILKSLHPLGKMWAINQLFAYLEQQADTQLLAFMSALLVRAFASQGCDPIPSQHRIASSHSDLAETQSTELESAILDMTMVPAALPILRANSSALSISEKPPIKRKTSQTSSRNTSQPPTPYLDSSASTPPLIFPPMARHGPKVFQSGSQSPEHHRTSFSNAAKSYAASIAEKIASYGSSPPARKNGAGTANELSTSLPNASAAGSWSKSVSFASTLGVGEPATRSLSLAQEDDRYDSDRTIEDSLPHTPRTSNSSVSFKLKNEIAFHQASAQEASEALPAEFLTKAILWRHHHAEQLRSWGYLQEAAELEAVLGVEQQGVQRELPSAVVCRAASTIGRATCIICYCVINTAKQLCPSCLHTAHPRCVDDFMSALDDAAYTCPSGCGCNCNEAADVEFGAMEDYLDAEQASTGSFRSGLKASS